MAKYQMLAKICTNTVNAISAILINVLRNFLSLNSNILVLQSKTSFIAFWRCSLLFGHVGFILNLQIAKIFENSKPDFRLIFFWNAFLLTKKRVLFGS